MMDDGSNTTPKQQGGVTGKGFVKGDPRINRKGRPKSFDALRELAQVIAHEQALSGGQPLVIDGHIATVAEMILRSWAASKNPQLVKAFTEGQVFFKILIPSLLPVIITAGTTVVIFTLNIFDVVG